MTSIALNKGFLVVQAIADFFSGISKAVIMARGVEANYKIAYQLKHEYPNKSVEAIAHDLNTRLRKEVYGD